MGKPGVWLRSCLGSCSSQCFEDQRLCWNRQGARALLMPLKPVDSLTEDLYVFPAFWLGWHLLETLTELCCMLVQVLCSLVKGDKWHLSCFFAEEVIPYMQDQGFLLCDALCNCNKAVLLLLVKPGRARRQDTRRDRQMDWFAVSGSVFLQQKWPLRFKSWALMMAVQAKWL